VVTTTIQMTTTMMATIALISRGPTTSVNDAAATITLT